MTELLLVGNFRVELEYKRVKTMRLTLYPPASGVLSAPGRPLPAEGRIRVSAPPHTSRQLIQDFVISKAAWIEKQRARFRRNPSPPGDDGICCVWGRPYRLELTERPARPRIALGEGRVLMSVRPGDDQEQRQKALDRWYRALCKEAATRITRFWEPRIGVTVQRIFYRKMKTHWGSCNYLNRTIRLNTELAKKAPECLEYVILHEMVHLLEPSHNRNFYRLMDRYLPSWKTVQLTLNLP